MVNKHFFLALSGLATLTTAVPAVAQIQSDGRQLMDAVKKGDGAQAMALLLANPSLVNTKDSNGTTPLLSAIELGKDEWTGFLIEKGADVNAADRDGNTPLILATRQSSENAVGWLLEKKAKVDLNNKVGETALILAVQIRNVPIAQRLLAAGANPDKEDYSGHSARDYAKQDDRNPRMAKLFERPAAAK